MSNSRHQIHTAILIFKHITNNLEYQCNKINAPITNPLTNLKKIQLKIIENNLSISSKSIRDGKPVPYNKSFHFCAKLSENMIIFFAKNAKKIVLCVKYTMKCTHIIRLKESKLQLRSYDEGMVDYFQ